MSTIGNIGVKLDLLIRQGATFGPVKVVSKNPDGSFLNLTGCVFRGAIRKSWDSPDIVATLTFDVTSLLGGAWEFGIPDGVTGGMTAGGSVKDAASKYVYDIEIEDTLNRVIPMYWGDASVHREITK